MTTTKSTVQKIRGLEKIEICKLENGVLPASPSWFEIGETVPDSAVITKGEDTQTEEYIEEVDVPTDSFVTQKAIRQASWRSRNFSGEVLAYVLGGTFNKPTVSEEGTWEEPAVSPEFEFALRFCSKNKVKMGFDRCTISISEESKFAKSSSADIGFLAKNLQSTDLAKSGFAITFPSGK